MPGNNKTIGDILKFYGSITLAAVLGPIGPWLQPFLNMKLITDYFQPWVNAAASAFAALAFLVAFGFLRKLGRERLKQTARWSLIVLGLAFVLCLWFRFSLGSVWTPNMTGTVLAWIAWVVAYIAIFVNLAITLCVAGFLAE